MMNAILTQLLILALICVGTGFCDRTTASPQRTVADYQVAISAVIIEVSESSARELGIELEFNARGDEGNYPDTILKKGLLNFPFSADKLFVPILDENRKFIRELRRPGIGLKLVGIDTDRWTLEAKLRALETNGNAEIKAQPIVVTLSGKTAKLTTSEEIPYLDIKFDEKKKRSTIFVNKKPVGITLEVTPTVHDNKMVDLEVKKLEISGVLSFVVSNKIQRPIFDTSFVENTSVLLKDGQGLMIGGLTSKRERNVQYRVPIIGSIPLLGIPFKWQKKRVEDTRVIFLITPFILEPGENPQLPPDFRHREETETLRLK